jgi:hypothetical protein
VHYKPYLRFHVEELRFDGESWWVAFTPRGITWEPKQFRPVPDLEMRRIWEVEKVPVSLDEKSLARYWKQIEGRVSEYLIREYWTLEKQK